MILFSNTLSPEEFKEIENPSVQQIEHALKSIFNRNIHMGFDVELFENKKTLSLSSLFHDQAVGIDLLNLVFYEEDAYSSLIENAPTNEKDLLEAGKTYYCDNNTIIWMQIHQMSVNEIILAFQSFSEGTDEWKHHFGFHLV